VELLGLSIRCWGRAGTAAEFVASLLLLWNGADSIWFRRFVLWLQATKRWGDTPGNQTPAPVRGAWFATYALVSGAGFMALFLLIGLDSATPAGEVKELPRKEGDPSTYDGFWALFSPDTVLAKPPDYLILYDPKFSPGDLHLGMLTPAW
jgi:hypothetical protein